MWREKIIPEEELEPYLEKLGDRGLPFRMMALYEQQKVNWSEFRNGHHALAEAQRRWVDLQGCRVLCQHTPHRMASVSARVDPDSVMNRPCFLCPENLYPEEQGLVYENDYLILCNVAPIFDFHLIIVHRRHLPQDVHPHYLMVLSLARAVAPHFVLIYNGPRCGASAPDHLHFQAFPGHNLPTEDQIHRSRDHRPVVEEAGIRIGAPHGLSRNLLVFEGTESNSLALWLDKTLGVLTEISDGPGEPMINLVVGYRAGQWRVLLFPRGRHRPQCYYERGDDRLLVSPGAIDMGGVFVMPRKEDYDRIDALLIEGIYQEVTLSEDRFVRLLEALRDEK